MVQKKELKVIQQIYFLLIKVQHTINPIMRAPIIDLLKRASQDKFT